MKKYISAILINAFLLQFVGCYTQKEITYDEFYFLPKQKEAKVITSDDVTIELTSDSLNNNYMFWYKGPDTLTIYSTHLEKVWSTALMEVTDTIHYPKEEITKVYITEYDESRTNTSIIISALLVGLIVIGFITYEPYSEGWEW